MCVCVKSRRDAIGFMAVIFFVAAASILTMFAHAGEGRLACNQPTDDPVPSDRERERERPSTTVPWSLISEFLKATVGSSTSPCV